VDVRRKALLAVVLDGAPLAGKRGILDHGFELAQLFQVVNPAMAETLTEQVREAGIREHDPAARCDAVGFVGEFFRRELKEIAQNMGLEQLSVQRGHAVDGVAAECGEVGHTHVTFPALLDDRQAAHAVLVTGKTVVDIVKVAAVDLFDDLKMAGKQCAEQRYGPLFQRLRHEGVIGVGEAVGGHVPGGLPFH
jgi:hypothetical protein